MVPVEPSPNWSECLVGFLVDVPNQPPKRFYMTWLHHSPPLRQGENLMFFVFFFLGGGASHCFALFFFSNEFVAQKELMGKWRNSRSRGKGQGLAKCQGRPSSAVGWRFFVFSFPPGSVYYLSQKSPYFLKGGVEIVMACFWSYLGEAYGS